MRNFVITLILLSLTLTGCRQPQTVNDTGAEDLNAASKTSKVTLEVVADDAQATDADLEVTGSDVVGYIYKDYSEADYNEYKGAAPFVLFFYADGSPVSAQTEKTFREESASFPKGTVILKADFDNEAGLRTEYGVDAESAVLVFNADGDVIYTSIDPAPDDFIAAIKRSMEP